MPRNKSGSANGGVIGKTNRTSFGKDTITTNSSSTPSITTQPGTRLVNTLIVAGGGGAGGGASRAGGGGAGGARNLSNLPTGGDNIGAVTVGGGGAGANGRQPDSYNGAAGGSGIVIIRYKFQ